MNDATRAFRIAALAAALVVPLAMVTACDRRQTEDDTSATPAEPQATPTAEAPQATPATPDATDATAAQPPAGATPPATGTLTQADALAMLVAVNEHEIAAADQAIRKNVTGKVREFAELMRKDHTKNLEDTTKLGAAASTAPAVTQMKTKGEEDLRTLDTHNGKEYEAAYVDAMVKGHTDVLSTIDSQLMPAATDAKVRDHLTATRAAVSSHLDRAKELQAQKQ